MVGNIGAAKVDVFGGHQQMVKTSQNQLRSEVATACGQAMFKGAYLHRIIS